MVANLAALVKLLGSFNPLMFSSLTVGQQTNDAAASVVTAVVAGATMLAAN